jgi:hypothetical protein
MAAARTAFKDVEEKDLLPGGAPARATDPVTGAAWIALARTLYATDRHVRYLDAIESATLNHLLFSLTSDGGAAAGRTLEGAAGQVDDTFAVSAAAGSLAIAADTTLFVDADGTLVCSQPANAVVELVVGGSASMRCLVSTQLPARGWSSWVFEPGLAVAAAAPAVATTRRTSRHQRTAVLQQSAPAASPAGAERFVFAFRVRVPKWAADAKIPPFVKIDGERANVKRSGGFIAFEVPSDRETRIEITFTMDPGLVDRESKVSWAREVAIVYGPSMLTAMARYNPDEDLGLPLRITSTLEELTVVTDVRRRLPVLQATVLSGGGRASRSLFTPISDVGGFTAGIGGRQDVLCQPFRTWHRWGR